METADKQVPGINITENILLGAAAAGNYSTLIYLLHRNRGLYANRYYSRIARLKKSVLNDDSATVHSLLQEGVLPDLKDYEGFTPLAHACNRGQCASAKAFLEFSHDIDLNTVSSIIYSQLKWGICRGRTPLCWAAISG